MLTDTFINAIFLYADKLVIAFNYKEAIGSGLDCSSA